MVLPIFDKFLSRPDNFRGKARTYWDIWASFDSYEGIKPSEKW